MNPDKLDIAYNEYLKARLSGMNIDAKYREYLKARNNARWQAQQDFDTYMQKALADGLDGIDCLVYIERQNLSLGHKVE